MIKFKLYIKAYIFNHVEKICHQLIIEIMSLEFS